MMNHEISLSLELVEQAAWEFRFKLTVQNRSDVKLLFPGPEITGIRFCDAATMKEAEWYTCLLVSADCCEFALEPKESCCFEWRVRPSDVERPESTADFDYFRWSVEIPIGNYSVSYRWHVADNYFDPDSHLTLQDLDAAAKREGASVWLGPAVSNRVQFVRA